MTEILKITNKKGLHHTDQINKLPSYIMPEISRKHKLSPYVDWDGRDLFIKLIANPNPIFAIFPKDRRKPCIHIRGGTSKTDREIEKHLMRIPENSLGVILGVAKDQPEDWGSKPEHKNKHGEICCHYRQ